MATVTEIYDYLRLLYARAGRPHCHVCGFPVASSTPQQMVEKVLTLPEKTRFMVLAPVVRGRKGEYGKIFKDLAESGYARVRVDGEIHELPVDLGLDKNYKHDIEVVVDRLVIREGIERRLTDSIETALEARRGAGPDRDGREDGRCWRVDALLRDLHVHELRGVHSGDTAEDVLVQQPARGLRPVRRAREPVGDRPGARRPERGSERQRGRGRAVGQLADGVPRERARGSSEKYGIDLNVPWRDLPEEHKKLILYGTDGERIYVSYRNRYNRRRQYMTQFDGVVEQPERRYAETDSEYRREKIEEFMSHVPCPKCKGARLRPEALAVTVGEKNIHEFTELCASGTRRTSSTRSISRRGSGSSASGSSRRSASASASSWTWAWAT